MIHSQSGAFVFMPAASAATTATQAMVFKTEGYGNAEIVVMVPAHATDGETIRQMGLGESDTSTAIASHTNIAAFTGDISATSTSASFVIPAAGATTGLGYLVVFNVDLRKRKKYLSLQITPGTTTMTISAIGKLTRGGSESADSATEKSAVLNYENGTDTTNIVSVQKFVVG